MCHLKMHILTSYCISFTIGIAGIRGGLGKELVQQSLEQRWNVIGYVKGSRSSPIHKPYRSGWLTDKQLERFDEEIGLYHVSEKCDYDALVLTMSGKPLTKLRHRLL